ncbi:MAG TPA: type II secretion system protein GspG [Candidatus Brocadiia bacterium]|nr:type II secretion system protein GspG [Planctomycetota bacterium]MBI4007033.1 type II secretion system protein GspG [Planctomycetota bacterium]MDO8092883.1 type II secretion system protein GspG [Candidatus Brocadiales bacterium]
MNTGTSGRRGFTPLQIATGFTLIEIVIVLGVIAALAAILVPTLMNYVEDAKKARASKDVGIIAAAIAQLNKDTGRWPIYDDVEGKTGAIDCLYTGAGTSTLETGDFAGTSPPLSFDKAFDHLMVNNSNYPSSGSNIWRGPYLSKDSADPWGTPYAILVKRFNGTVGVYAWVLSAGPDGMFQTDEASIEIPTDSDDVGILIQ